MEFRKKNYILKKKESTEGEKDLRAGYKSAPPITTRGISTMWNFMDFAAISHNIM